MTRFWTCSVSGCTKAASIDGGGCEWCQKQYCLSHVRSPEHQCPDDPLDDETWEARQMAELEGLKKKIRVEALLLEASKSRYGVACEVDIADPLGRRRMGGMHIHLRLRFADGVSWLARIPRQNFTSFPANLTDEILLSECAVLRWLESTQIPAPRLHKYALGHDNDVGTPYMLVDELPGTTFDQYSATEEQTNKVYVQIAEIQSIIHSHPFDLVGSLTMDSNEAVYVGPITGDRSGFLAQLGPFSDAKAFYVGYTEEHLRLIIDGQLWGQYPADAYLMFKYLRELALQGKYNPLEGAGDERPFYLKHTDDKGDHILVDSQFNITGVIDWSFARTLPVHDAFGPSLLTADLDQLLRGEEGLSVQDRLFASALDSKCPKLSRFMRAPDTCRRFIFSLGLGMNPTLEEAIVIFKATVETLARHSISNWADWREEQFQRWAGDEALQRLSQTASASTTAPQEAVIVDAVASNRWVALGKHGPFGTAREYYTHITEEYLDLVADGQLYYEYPVEAFAFYKLLQSKIPLLLDQRADEGFYPKQVDDKGDHLLVDKAYNVVGIIDWQFARVVPAREAFGPSLLTADLDDLYSGRGRLSDADLEPAGILRRVGSGLAGYMDGELVRRFHMGLASGFSREDVRDVLTGMLASTREDTENIDVRGWMKEQVGLLAGDPRWGKVKALALELGNWDDEWDGLDRRPG